MVNASSVQFQVRDCGASSAGRPHAKTYKSVSGLLGPVGLWNSPQLRQLAGHFVHRVVTLPLFRLVVDRARITAPSSGRSCCRSAGRASSNKSRLVFPHCNCRPLPYTALVKLLYSAKAMKLVPITEWLPQYPRANLRGDVIAGIALAGLLIPESMGYAGIAGLPPQAGLYATAFGLLAYAIFGSSRQLVVSASSAIMAATVAPMAAADPEKFMVLASAVTLVLGLLFLVAGVLKLGFLSDFISKPVLKGFVFGVALSIVIKQLPKFLGIAPGKGHAYVQLWRTVQHATEANPWTVAAGIIALAVLFAMDRYVPKLPGA